METLTKKDFKEMLWKNGGGVSTELLRFSEEDKILLRLSVATVSSPGPFSLFPGLCRHLLILSGAGVRLRSPAFEVTLTPRSDVFRFSGDVPVDCELLGGSVLDFNLMHDESYATVRIESKHDCTVRCTEDETMLFLPDRFELLRLARGEEITVREKFIKVEIARPAGGPP